MLSPVETLQITGGGGSLTISSDDGPEPLFWHVTLVSGGLHARTDLDLDAIRHHVAPLGEFFASLAQEWRGWEGARSWGVTPITLSATHDGLGHITLAVHLKTNVFREPSWSAAATVVVEAGRLDRLAREASRLPRLYPV
jgi:hypothetical protein